MTKKALLLIDVLNSFDFSHGDVLANKTTAMIPTILKLKQSFYERNEPIIYINDHYNLWEADIKRIVQEISNPTSKPIIDSLFPDKNDYFLIKPKHSAFYGTALQTLLHQLHVTNLVLAGIAGNICVLFTANDAYMREFPLHVPENAIASVSDDDQIYALRMMKNVLKADTTKF
ncbi:isochorismatase family cysteine hydrolase [Mangrovibacillus cuniculi]|uniref:Cysteine hydrolase n=1 Tax=Mangrovibacillus cuniculi TaxID=2593652 RepID=A0A7S8CDF6_9BACI|nr:isochorismatase family cysteine hydrolase [Mangrovibacillus cuniculi]QPC47949.1 cysteine hydrolase [Mangrovibacillus cuniculi]